MREKYAHALNVPGDFYVEDGCCVSCDMPFREAPGHFKYDDGGHCYVCKQPSTADEMERMVSAINVSEVSCIRYAGNDPKILAELVALNEGARCDVLVADLPAAAVPKKVWWMLWRR